MKIVYKTDVGNVRKINEDSLCIQTNELAHTLCAVADGMGGHNAREVASKLAIQTIKEQFAKAQYTNIKDFLKETILKANTLIYTNSLISEEYSKMGTTLSMVIMDEKNIYIGHIGDSRIYYLNENKEKPVQLTKDHTMVQLMYEEGHITKEELPNHPYRNVLAQSLGTARKIKVDIKEIKLPPKGYLLVCSDGLTDELTDEEIYDNVVGEEIEISAQKMLTKVLNKQGKDNITFILIKR